MHRRPTNYHAVFDWPLPPSNLPLLTDQKSHMFPPPETFALWSGNREMSKGSPWWWWLRTTWLNLRHAGRYNILIVEFIRFFSSQYIHRCPMECNSGVGRISNIKQSKSHSAQTPLNSNCIQNITKTLSDLRNLVPSPTHIFLSS